jgi:hypothetical protein
MGACPQENEARGVLDEKEITAAALGAYGHLRAIIGERLRMHPAWDGGLICEDHRSCTRPALWRISPDGSVLPDSRYSFTLRAFTAVALPQGV